MTWSRPKFKSRLDSDCGIVSLLFSVWFAASVIFQQLQAAPKAEAKGKARRKRKGTLEKQAGAVVVAFAVGMGLCNGLIFGAGKYYQNRLLTKACAATFSFVTIMIVKDGSITSRPAIMAAAERVLPAPKTPLMGQSVLPSSRQ